MFTLVTGVPGAGKTYYVLCKYIVPELAQKTGRQIITNIPLNLKAIADVYGNEAVASIEVFDGSYSDIDIYKDDDSDSFKKAVLFIIDECQEHFTKEKIEDDEGKPTFEYFARHRKYVCDFVLITQNPRLISRKVRALVEYAHYLAKTRSIGGNGYIVKSYAGQSSRSSPINQQEHEYKPEYFGFYRSYSDEDSKEISDIKASLGTKLLVFVYNNRFSLAVLILVFCAVSLYRSFHRSAKAPESVPAASRSLARPAPASSVASVPSAIEGVTGYEFGRLAVAFQGDQLLSCRLRRWSKSPQKDAPLLSAAASSSPESLQSVVVPCAAIGAHVQRVGSDIIILLPDGRRVF